MMKNFKKLLLAGLLLLVCTACDAPEYYEYQCKVYDPSGRVAVYNQSQNFIFAVPSRSECRQIEVGGNRFIEVRFSDGREGYVEAHQLYRTEGKSFPENLKNSDNKAGKSIGLAVAQMIDSDLHYKLLQPAWRYSIMAALTVILLLTYVFYGTKNRWGVLLSGAVAMVMEVLCILSWCGVQPVVDVELLDFLRTHIFLIDLLIWVAVVIMGLIYYAALIVGVIAIPLMIGLTLAPSQKLRYLNIASGAVVVLGFLLMWWSGFESSATAESMFIALGIAFAITVVGVVQGLASGNFANLFSLLLPVLYLVAMVAAFSLLGVFLSLLGIVLIILLIEGFMGVSPGAGGGNRNGGGSSGGSDSGVDWRTNDEYGSQINLRSRGGGYADDQYGGQWRRDGGSWHRD